MCDTANDSPRPTRLVTPMRTVRFPKRLASRTSTMGTRIPSSSLVRSGQHDVPVSHTIYHISFTPAEIDVFLLVTPIGAFPAAPVTPTRTVSPTNDATPLDTATELVSPNPRNRLKRGTSAPRTRSVRRSRVVWIMERECRLVFPSESLVVPEILMQVMLLLSKAVSSSMVFFLGSTRLPRSGIAVLADSLPNVLTMRAVRLPTTRTNLPSTSVSPSESPRRLRDRFENVCQALRSTERDADSS